MSDNAFSSPGSEPRMFDVPMLTPAVKTISVVAIVFGVLGVMQGLLGLAGLAVQSAANEMAIKAAPPGAGDEARVMIETAAQLAPVGVVISLAGLALSILLILAGITALKQAKASMLQLATMLAVAFILVAELGYGVFFTQFWLYESQTAYHEAVAASTGGVDAATLKAITQGSTMFGVVLAALFILVRAGFYVWAFLTTQAFNASLAEDDH